MFTVRQALLEDLTQVRDIGIRTYRAHFGELWRYPHELEAFLAEDFSVSALERTLRDPDVCWLLAYEDDARSAMRGSTSTACWRQRKPAAQSCRKSISCRAMPATAMASACSNRCNSGPSSAGRRRCGWKCCNVTPAPNAFISAGIEHLWRDLLHQRPWLDRHLVYEQGAVTAPRSAVV